MSWQVPVFSSNVNEVGYDDKQQALIIVWKSGKTSAYAGVDEATALQCSRAPTVGGFLNTEIKPVYAHRYI